MVLDSRPEESPGQEKADESTGDVPGNRSVYTESRGNQDKNQSDFYYGNAGGGDGLPAESSQSVEVTCVIRGVNSICRDSQGGQPDVGGLGSVAQRFGDNAGQSQVKPEDNYAEYQLYPVRLPDDAAREKRAAPELPKPL